MKQITHFFFFGRRESDFKIILQYKSTPLFNIMVSFSIIIRYYFCTNFEFLLNVEVLTKTYSEPSQTSKMEFFTKIANSLFHKKINLRSLTSSECTQPYPMRIFFAIRGQLFFKY